MTQQFITLKHLCFTGPNKEPASVEFGHGLNVIYGASETGKSFILEALDFMLGASVPLRDIPERVGFDRVFLGLEFSGDGLYTFERGTVGGDFRCYKGLHKLVPEGLEYTVLKAKHKAGATNTVSAFLLQRIGLWNKRLRRNAKGDTNSLSFRNLSHLTLISEQDIQKRSSPLLTGQFTSKTVETAVFKLLLSNVDDSAVQPESKDERITISRVAKVEVIDELLSDYKSQLDDIAGDGEQKDFESQLERLEKTLEKQRSVMRSTEKDYQHAVSHRNQIRQKMGAIERRRIEIHEMSARFNLLDQHYQTDLLRLDGIQEAGSLIGALEPNGCPLCGSPASEQHLSKACDGNIDMIVEATLAEKVKITSLKGDLSDTVERMDKELIQLNRDHNSISEDLEKINKRLKELSPSMSKNQTSYTELIEKKSNIHNILRLLQSISTLEDKRVSMGEPEHERASPTEIVEDLSSSTLDTFSVMMEKILQLWNFPDAGRVHFDRKDSDLVISGKPRGSRGKGMRAITHAAFTAGLLRYTEENKLPHPGFIVLDTPLLAYREPENDDDDLRETDVHSKFYEYLAKWTSRQVIILENEDPPASIKNSIQTTFFTKSLTVGRYGFLPLS